MLPTRREIVRVCKTWYQIGTPILYSTLVLGPHMPTHVSLLSSSQIHLRLVKALLIVPMTGSPHIENGRLPDPAHLCSLVIPRLSTLQIYSDTPMSLPPRHPNLQAALCSLLYSSTPSLRYFSSAGVFTLCNNDMGPNGRCLGSVRSLDALLVPFDDTGRQQSFPYNLSFPNLHTMTLALGHYQPEICTWDLPTLRTLAILSGVVNVPDPNYNVLSQPLFSKLGPKILALELRSYSYPELHIFRSPQNPRLSLFCSLQRLYLPVVNISGILPYFLPTFTLKTLGVILHEHHPNDAGCTLEPITQVVKMEQWPQLKRVVLIDDFPAGEAEDQESRKMIWHHHYQGVFQAYGVDLM